jgi:hypothetical protein
MTALHDGQALQYFEPQFLSWAVHCSRALSDREPLRLMSIYICQCKDEVCMLL